MPKTGTCSLTDAIWRLHPKDLRMVHSDPVIDARIQANLIQGDVTRAIPSGYCGAIETPEIRASYQSIHQQDPDALFILTVRNLDGWLDSMVAHRKMNGDRRLWDVFHQTRKEMMEDYTNHFLGVMEYFREGGWPGQLLVLNVVEGEDAENWQKLARFLGFNCPEGQKFPHKNQTPKKYFL